MEKRCSWAEDSPLAIEYHDREWGVPVYDDKCLFELLTLEGAQAGLSWITILKKRNGYRRAFANFNPAKVSRYDGPKIEKLMEDTSIVRNRLKIESTVNNASRVLEVQEEFGSLDQYIWQFVDGKPIQNRWRSMKYVPAETALSKQLSKDLKKRGFRFVGPTICYAFMQAIGMVNDHQTNCFRYSEITNIKD